jgi:hypothetical protein
MVREAATIVTYQIRAKRAAQWDMPIDSRGVWTVTIEPSGVTRYVP